MVFRLDFETAPFDHSGISPHTSIGRVGRQPNEKGTGPQAVAASSAALW